jgi:hypothetical protein
LIFGILLLAWLFCKSIRFDLALFPLQSHSFFLRVWIHETVGIAIVPTYAPCIVEIAYRTWITLCSFGLLGKLICHCWLEPRRWVHGWYCTLVASHFSQIQGKKARRNSWCRPTLPFTNPNSRARHHFVPFARRNHLLHVLETRALSSVDCCCPTLFLGGSAATASYHCGIHCNYRWILYYWTTRTPHLFLPTCFGSCPLLVTHDW